VEEPAVTEYVEYLKEVFELFGPVQARRMFGGYGLYHEGLMFALVSRDVLYLKTDDTNRPDFEALGLGPFEYTKQGGLQKIAYHRAPDEVMDDRELAAVWARRSFAAALRARAREVRPKAE